MTRLVPLFALALVACKKDDPGTDTSPFTAPPTERFDWQPCPVNTPIAGDQAECATVDLPLFHDAPEQGTAQIAVRRYRTSDSPPGQLWLVQGGPGGSVLRFDPFLPGIAERTGGMDLYMMEHRGVGDSERFGCPVQEAVGSEADVIVTATEMPACWDWLAANRSIDAFTTTAAARDLNALVERGRQPDLPVHVFGVSYGTLVVQRFLALFPDGADSAILDSIVPHLPGDQPMEWLGHWDDVARDFLGRCADDPACRASVGQDPIPALEGALDTLTTTCPDLTAGPVTLRNQLAHLLERPDLRVALPGFVRRLVRCSPDDLVAMQYALDAPVRYPRFAEDPDAAAAESMFGLLPYVSRVEFWERDAPTRGEYEAALDATLAAESIHLDLIEPYGALQTYAPDDIQGRLPDTGMPVLMAIGGLDARTPPDSSAALRDRLSGPAQWSVLFPTAGHALYGYTPEGGTHGDGCFFDVLEAFLIDPSVAPDTTCVDDVAPVDFASRSDRSQAIFGTDDYYD